MKTGLVTDPLFAEHDTGPGHPERAERLPAIARHIAGLDLTRVEPRDANMAELEAAHDPDYLRATRDAIAGGADRLDADTVTCPVSFRAAVRAAGGALALADAWLAGRIEAGFAAVRPPGHHACRGRAMGFCLINNMAVLALYLKARGKRVAIVDWDVHHGNGTQDILWEEPEIGYCSLHQSPLYPGSGAASETGAGNILNLPLPAGCGDREYLTVFDDKVLPWLTQRDPEVVLISAGFDAHRRDPLAGMRLSSGAFGEFTTRLLRWPLLSLLEGGYDLEGLGESVHAHLQALIEA